jgi:nucleotide-binding universal stress UspA family protein
MTERAHREPVVMGRLVVGVDGSDGSAAALRWALKEARVRSATVLVNPVLAHGAAAPSTACTTAPAQSPLCATPAVQPKE